MDEGVRIGPVQSQTVTDSLVGDTRLTVGDIVGALRLGLPDSHILGCAVRQRKQFCNHTEAERGHLAPQLWRDAPIVRTLLFVLVRGGRAAAHFQFS